MIQFKKSKKAMSAVMIALVSAVIFALGIIAVLYLFQGIAKASEQNTYITTCKASVASYARVGAISIPGAKGEAEESTINCPTRYVTIDSDTDRNMKRDIANLMVECFDIYGRGEVKLFKAQDMKFCAICSVFEFEDKKTQLENLPSFMKTEKSPVRVKGRSLTYSEFLTGVLTGPEAVEEAKIEEVSALSGDKKYAIIFSYFSGTRREPFLLVFELSTPGAEWHAQTILTEYDADSIQKIGCDILPISQLDQKFR